MNLFASSDVVADNGWKVSVNVEPLMNVLEKGKYYFSNYVMDFTLVHWYVLSCWLLSFFIVPVKFRSLGSVVISPLWLPFWLVARVLTSVLAVKRANNTLAMSDHYATSTAKVEAMVPQIQNAADRLVGVSTNFDKLNNSVSGVDRKLSVMMEGFDDNLDMVKDLKNTFKLLHEQLVLNAKQISDQKVLIDSLKTQLGDNASKFEAEKLAKFNVKLMEDQLSMIEKLLKSNSASPNGHSVMLSDSLENDSAKKILDQILKKFSDKSDDYYVGLGHVATNADGKMSFVYQLGVRLGALRGKESFNPDRDLYVGEKSRNLDMAPVAKLVKQDIPVAKKFNDNVKNNSSRLLDDNDFLRNL